MVTLAELTPKQWSEISSKSHLVVFGVTDRSAIDKVDRAFLFVVNSDKAAGFFTVKDMDEETVYIQHGGVFPNCKKSLYVMEGFYKAVNHLLQGKKRIWFKVLNTNIPMIKLALKGGFLITGCNLHKNNLYLEMSKEVL